MGSASISVIAVFLVIFATNFVTASTRCPPPNQIYEFQEKEPCHTDSQCPKDTVCCVTPARNKVCAQPAFGSQAQTYDKYDHGQKNSGTGIYCGNKKCGPSEKCAEERGRPICKHT